MFKQGFSGQASRKKNFSWQFLASPKLAIIILILLGITCAIGTFVPQDKVFHYYTHRYGFRIGFWLFKLGLTKIYHSYLFIGLLLIFSINLIACSVRRIISFKKEDSLTIDKEYLNTLELKEMLFSVKAINELKEKIFQILSKKRFKFLSRQDGSTMLISSHKGKSAIFGPYLVHLSLLVIILAGVFTIRFSSRGELKILEGTVAEISHLSAQTFQIRLDKFDIEYYPQTRNVKDYKSTLSVLENAKKVLTKTIEVNKPLSYKGITFYQSSYGYQWDAVMLIVKQKQKSNVYKVKLGQEFVIPGAGVTVLVDRFVPDLLVEKGKGITTKSEEPLNPACHIIVYQNGEKEEGKEKSLWIAAKFPQHASYKQGDLVISLMQGVSTAYTVLGVVKDPGALAFWLGSGLLLVGIFTSLFIYHRRVYGLIKEDGERTSILIAAETKRNKMAFKKEFTQLVAAIKEVIGR